MYLVMWIEWMKTEIQKRHDEQLLSPPALFAQRPRAT